MTTYGTIPDVELLSVGMDWPACTGEHTVTFENIADAIRAANDDPLIQTPRVKLGHFSVLNDGIPMWDPFAVITDAEPVFGRVVNLRATNDGATLVGDLVEVPEWLMASAVSAFPTRSAESVPDVTTQGGKRYSMVLTAVALLGAELPAVSDLDDLQRLIESGPEAAATAASRQEGILPSKPTAATPAPTAGSISTSTIRERFNYDWAMTEPIDGLDTYWWWARDIRVDPDEIIADDDEGNLWSVPYSTDGVDGVTFGNPARVLETYVPAPAAASAMTATAPESQRVLGVFSRPTKKQRPTTAASERPAIPDERNPMDESVRKALAAAHGLDPDSATEEQVNAAVLAAAEASAGEPDAPAEPDPAPVQTTTVTPAPATEPAPAPAAEEPIVTPPVTPPVAEPAPVVAATEPDTVIEQPDTVPVSREVWEQTQTDLRDLIADRDERVAAATTARRDGKADGWVRTGRITPAERALARTNLDINEAETTKAYDALAPGKVPVTKDPVAVAASKAATSGEDALYEASRLRMGAGPSTKEA